jgi:hypothetical protein
MTMPHEATEPPAYLTRAEVCHLLRCSSGTLKNWEARGILTAKKVGPKKTLYERRGVYALLGLEEPGKKKPPRKRAQAAT